MKLRTKHEDVEPEDELEAEELKEKRLEMRKLKMERDLLKMQAETEKVRQELEKYRGGSVNTNPDSQAAALGAMTASLIKAGVKPEQANEFFSKMNPESLAVLSSLTSSNPYLPVFMFLASQSKGQAPQSMTPKDIIELNKGVYELAKDIGGKGKDESDTLNVVRDLVGMVKDITQQRLVEKLDELKDVVASRSSSIWDEILEDEKKFTRFKELFGGSSAKPEIQLELEKLRQQHELNLKRLDLELLKLRGEMLESRRKTKMFSQALKKIGEAVGEGLEEASEEGARGAVQQPLTLKCPKCNTDIPNVTPGAQVTCPTCKTVYVVRQKSG